MILPIKKVVLSGFITLFACCTAYAIKQSIDLSGWSLEHNTSTPTHTCNSTTHKHETFVTHHQNYDKYIESCINKETQNYILYENFIYHDQMNASDLNSPSDNINNPDLTPSHDPLSDSALETRKQGIEENQVAQISEHNKNFQTNGKIICELLIPKNKILYQSDIEGCTFDSTIILDKIHTIKDLITALISPIIKARFERIKRTIESINIPKKGRDHRLKNELEFIDLLISGRITELLELIMHPDLNIAQSAFDELKQLWPFKREHTFLGCVLKYGTGEPGFITAILGVDIMKIAEKSLITRQDYIAKHANEQEQKTIHEYREKCYLLQQKGNSADLFNQTQQLSRCINQNSSKNDLIANVCLAIAENCWLDPITRVFHSIIHEPSLERACDHLKNLEKQIIIQAKQHGIIPMSEIRTWVIDHYGFDVFDAAHNCYKSRADYVYTPNNQSYLSDTIKPILNNIESRPLPRAHAELVNLEQQIDKVLAERNITDPVAQKEYIKKALGRDVLQLAHKKYEARSDHKKLVESFLAIDVNQATATILENNNNYESVSHALEKVAEQILDNAKLCNFDFVPQIEDHILESLHVIRSPKNVAEFVFHTTVVDHLLTDLQCQSEAIVAGEPAIWKRVPELFVHGMTTFISRLNPITQAHDIAHLGYDIGHLLGKAVDKSIDRVIEEIHDPIGTTQQYCDSAILACKYIINTARFTCDTISGVYYLSPEERSQRLEAYCKSAGEIYKHIESQTTAKQIVETTGYILGDLVFGRGVSTAAVFLKEIDAFGKISHEAKIITQGLRSAIEEHPAFATAEGIVLKMSNEIKDVGNAAKAMRPAIIDSVFLHKLKSVGDNIWQSPAGIIYGNDKKFGNTLNHMLAHMAFDPTKKVHTVFSVPKNKIVELIDEAWMLKGNPLPSDPSAYLVDMKKIIGTQGETTIRIIVKKPGTSELLTAYPVKI